MVELISFAWIMLEVGCEMLFCSGFLTHRKTKTSFITPLVFGICIFVHTNYLSSVVPTIFGTFVLHILLAVICYSGPWYKYLISVAMCLLLLSATDTLLIYAGSAIMKVSFEVLYSRKYTYLALVTLSKAFSLFVAWLYCHFWATKKELRTKTRWMALAVLFPLVSLVMLVVLFDSYKIQTDISSKAFVFTCALALGNIAIMYLLYRLEKNEQEARQNVLLRHQMDIQLQSFQALEKSYRAQRAAAHEFSHHLSTIDSLLSKGNTCDAISYVRTLQEKQTARVFSINSHHQIVDAVLNQKYQLAKEKQIDMQVKLNNLEHLPVSIDALVVLLSNLLDNAIEACDRCGTEKEINCVFIMKDVFFLMVENTSQPVEIIDGEIASTKHDSGEHGYGLANVKHILNELQAEYTFFYQDGRFKFVAEIPYCKN